jgi:hypothetical protein
MATAKPKKDVSAFRAAHDNNVIVPTKIKAAFADMKKTGDAFEYEGDFVKRAKLSQTQLGAFREMFADHIVQTTGKNQKKAWFHDVKTAAEMREAIG